jgi:DME family drug/metabolite transporter
VNQRLKGYALALAAACIWATLGLFYKTLAGYGLPLLTIVFFRAAVAAIVLFLALAGLRRNWLRLARADWPLFLIFGLFGVAAFYIIYIYAVSLSGVGMAAVLMYTAPAWVTLFDALVLRERLSVVKVSALIVAVAGCALIGRVYDPDSVRINLPGILAGLGTGLAYGAYIIFSKVAQRRYTTWTTLMYALGLGSLFLLPLQPIDGLVRAFTTPPALLLLLLLSLLPTLGGGIAFNAAVRLLPASEASIVATVEPVIAALLAWVTLGEQLEPLQLVGGAAILGAVGILQWHTGRSQPNALREGRQATAEESADAIGS